ncbi:LVIVD repeat-containing protein [Roseomonas sp. BN140053]|uniref:LVIVD repeat-containing protein n=1 Tax=Roseomonas sp. BN140053 TaxID=3391898 RepID=UPI0039EB513D
MDGALSARGLRRVAWLDIPGGGQVRVEGRWAYVGHMKPPHGTTILDIADPRNPRVVATIAPPVPASPTHVSHTHKVRVAGDIMVTNVEQDERHPLRRAQRIPEIEATHLAQHGRPIGDTELAAAIKVKPEFLPRARAVLAASPYAEGGFRVWDISDRARPRLLAHQRTGGVGVHRFDLDTRYAYISTEMPGYVGNILVIFDMADPSRPEEVSRWWMPGQHVAGGEVPTWPGQQHRLHHALRQGDTLWAAVWYAGIRAVDVSDIRNPRTIGAVNYHPPFPEPTHTVMRVPFPVRGRELAVAVDEEHEHVPGQLHGGIWVFDVSDPANMTPVSMWHLSELESPFVRRGRFGAHQFQERMRDTCLYVTWFSGGLRVVDIADPEAPAEVAHWLPEPPPGEDSPQFNDVDLDGNGLVYVLDRNRGLDILERVG